MPFHLSLYFFSGPEKLRDREYLGTVQNCKMNADYAAVSFEGKVNLHMVCSSCSTIPCFHEYLISFL